MAESEKVAPDHLLDSIFDAVHDDLVITDGQGVILRVSSSCQDLYGLTAEEMVGRTVYELEAAGVFVPSVTAMVLQERRKKTIIQRNREGRQIVVTATPVFDTDGRIVRVVSYSRDISDYLALKEQYRALERLMERYTSEIKELRWREVQVHGLIAESEAMQRVVKLVQKVAGVDANVLILGESGVGKSLIARMIHRLSPRRDGPFITINCGAIPESLLESELFGYEAGAFTGARREGKLGLIELAQDGTLFLDEIGELPPVLQVKLLQVIQEKTLTRVGGNRSIEVNFRLVAASNRDLARLVDEGRFRQDLYYRLAVVPIHIPPLRERPDDIYPLAMYFLRRCNKKYGYERTLDPRVIDAFLTYSWPGNVRELENLVERLVITSDDVTITCRSLPENICSPREEEEDGLTLREALRRLEARLVRQAYERFGTTTAVGRALGISQASAARKIRRYVSRAGH